MGSGPLMHDLHKASDLGLQLRLPVDLVPSGQYSRLSNCFALIEGELRTRDGLELVAYVAQVAAVSMLERTATGILNASIARTVYPHGYVVGDSVTLVVTDTSAGEGSLATPGSYVRTVDAVLSPTRFSFTPDAPVVWDPLATTVRVFAQATSDGAINTLAQTAVTNVYRLNQALQSIPGDRLVAIVGRLFRAQLPAGDVFAELVLPSLAGESPLVANGFSGSPLSIASFRFTLASETWAIIADTAKMAKFRESGDAQNDALFFLLGNPVPITPASAAVHAAGNLTGDYDWRYTCYDGYVVTEGNPSPGTDSGTVETVFATAQATPVPAHNTGGSFAYTNAAFTGVSNTGGSGHATQDGGKTPITANSFNQASCIWRGFPNPSATAFVIQLSVTWQVSVVKPDVAPIQVQLQYSTDAGASFTTYAFASATQGELTSNVNLPLGTDLTKVQFQCWGFCNAHASGGTFVPGGSFTVTIQNVQINCNLNPTSSMLTLAAQSAEVTVADPGTLNDGRVTGIRLYRRGGTLTDAYRLVGTYPLDTLSPASDGPNLAGAGATGAGGGLVVAWTNPANVTSAVGYATASLAFLDSTAQVKATVFGFAVTTGTIVGITVTCEAFSDVAGPTLEVQLLKAGVAITSPRSDALPTASGTLTFGGSLDDWGAGFTPADVSQTTFGVQFRTTTTPLAGANVSLRRVRITLTIGGFFELIDNVSDTTLSTSPIMELDNDAPVTSVAVVGQPLSQVWGPAGIEARLLGCGDPGRPESVYFSKPGNADAWPPQNHIEVADPGVAMVSGCVFNNQTYAFSRERVYQLVEGYVPGVTFTPFQTPSAHGLYCPTGLALGPLMYFVSKDGIYASAGGVETSIVENDIKPLFPTYDSPGEDVNGYEAVDMAQPDAIRLRYHNDELYFSYTGATTGSRQLLVYDLLKKRWRAAAYTVGVSEPYSEPGTVSSLLMGTSGGALYQSSGPLDPSQLSTIEGLNIVSTATSAVTLAAGSYYARLTRLTALGEMSLSNEFPAIVVNATHGIGLDVPEGPEDTTAWRLYYGLALGQEDQYVEFSESSLASSRSVLVKVAGTAASVPTVNADSRISVRLRTGAHDQGQPLNRKQYSNLLADLAPAGSTVSITPIIDGETQTESTLVVNGTSRDQFPLDLSDFFAFNTEYEITWQREPASATGPTLFQYDTLWFSEPVGVLKWATQPSSYGMAGYMHVRDIYIAIRSTADATLSVVIDGTTTQTYIVPASGGIRLKQYIQLASNKGKVYQLTLGSDEEFRVYESDLEVRIKGWLGLLGYAIVRPLGAEQQG